VLTASGLTLGFFLGDTETALSAFDRAINRNAVPMEPRDRLVRSLQFQRDDPQSPCGPANLYALCGRLAAR
jgi:hypothetical protein